jgi:hypothetical protein
VSLRRVTPAIETKFYPDGRVRSFPGSSIVCAVDPASRLLRACERVQERCRHERFSGAFAYLPPESFHMTLFDLLCDHVRVEERWSQAIALDAPLDRTDVLLTEMLERVEWPQAPRMRVTGLGELGGDHTLHLRLEPVDEATAGSLGAFREAVSRATQIRHPGHERYFFHVSLAYPLRALNEAEGQDYPQFEAEESERLRRQPDEVTLGRPYLSCFEDMAGFPRRRP